MPRAACTAERKCIDGYSSVAYKLRSGWTCLDGIRARLVVFSVRARLRDRLLVRMNKGSRHGNREEMRVVFGSAAGTAGGRAPGVTAHDAWP